MTRAGQVTKPVRPGLGGDLAGSSSRPGRTTVSGPQRRLNVGGLLTRMTGRALPADRPRDVPMGQWTAGSSLLSRLSVPLLALAVASGPVAVVSAVLAARAATTPTGSTGAEQAPDLVARRVAASEVALGFVRAWLSTKAADASTLKRWWSGELRLPERPSAVGQAQVIDAVAVAPGVWSVTVAADVAPAAGGDTQRRYFQLPVTVDGGVGTAGARPMTLPAEVAAPATSGTAALSYGTSISPSSAAGSTITGFLSALLTGTGDLTRWTAPGSAIRPVAPPVYRSVQLVSATADADPPGLGTGTPADAATTKVLVTVDLDLQAAPPTTTPATPAATPTGSADAATTTGQYLLTLTARAGRWEVASLDDTPSTLTK